MLTPRLPFSPWPAACALLLLAGCGLTEKEKKDPEFRTSGNREADQRASEQVQKVQQLRGEGMNQTDTHRSLYDRLGGEAGLVAITDDWIDRAMNDMRVNWKRVGVKSGGLLGTNVRAKDMSWNPTPAKVAEMKKHIVQFFSLSTGGPTFYDGRDMKGRYTGLGITNAEFAACVGDLKIALETLSVQTQEQKELLSIVESTRPMIVEER